MVRYQIKYTLCFLLFCLSITQPQNTFAQSNHKNLLKGDKFYAAGEYNLAEEEYRKARADEKDIKSSFNLGNTVYLQERYEEAVDHYTAAAQLAPDNFKRSDAYYNLGNALFKNEKFEEAIDAYKEAISLDENNEEARYNLLVAKQILKQAQQQEQQQQQDSDQQENQEQQENQDQQQQQQDQENQEQQEQQENEEQQEQENQEQQDSIQQDQDIQNSAFDTTRLDKQTLDSLDAMKLLQIIENEEMKVQEKLKKFNSDRKKPEKDW